MFTQENLPEIIDQYSNGALYVRYGSFVISTKLISTSGQYS